MNDNDIRITILRHLKEKERNPQLPTIKEDEYAKQLGITIEHLYSLEKYLEEKRCILRHRSLSNVFNYTITARGIDILEKYESQNTKSSRRSDSEPTVVLDIPKDDFQGILDVFISHKMEIENQKMSVTLRSVLRSKKIEGYIAESKFDLELLLHQKIREQIDNSDYVVGIITKESEHSASVNQELGYALGKGKPVLLLVEKGAEHGVLTHGKDVVVFTRSAFEKECSKIVEYILENKQNKKIRSTKDFDLLLDKFTENGNHYVGVRNVKGKTIQSCSVHCERKICIWWDDYEPHPRHIMEGGAGNVMLPLGFANTNPSITVLSAGDIVEEIQLNKIARRAGSKWSAKDDDDIHVERVRSTINRIISELANIQSLFQIFLDYKKGFPIDDQIRLYLSQKDNSVERLQNITNQSAYLLEPDWASDITDLCVNAKKNPWLLPGKVQVLQCEICEGVINQAKSLLDKLPNPPV